MTITFASVAFIIVLAIIFRTTLKKANESLPEVANNILGSAVKASKALDSTVTVNCLEHGAELTARAQEAMETINDLGGVANFEELYNSVYNIQPKKARRSATASTTSTTTA